MLDWVGRLKRYALASHGLTVIEILVALMVVAILMIVAVPTYRGKQVRAQDTDIWVKLGIAYKQAKLLNAENNGSFVSVESVQQQIEQGEPELRPTETAASTADVLTTGLVYVIRADAQGNLTLAAKSRSGITFWLNVDLNGAPSWDGSGGSGFSVLPAGATPGQTGCCS